MESTSVTAEHRPLPTTLTDPTFLVRAALFRRVDPADFSLLRRQQGLEVILQPYYGQGASEEEIRDVVKRAEAFYLCS